MLYKRNQICQERTYSLFTKISFLTFKIFLLASQYFYLFFNSIYVCMKLNCKNLSVLSLNCTLYGQVQSRFVRNLEVNESCLHEVQAPRAVERRSMANAMIHIEPESALFQSVDILTQNATVSALLGWSFDIWRSLKAFAEGCAKEVV